VKTLIGGLIQNREAAVPGIAAFAAEACAALGDAEVFVFENNSNDGTPARLAEISARDSRIKVRSEQWDLDAFRDQAEGRNLENKPCRIELIAEARNRLLDWMLDNCPEGDHRIVMIDWDFVSPPSTQKLAKWVREIPDEVDGVFANGIDSAGKYYDLYELRTERFPFGPELAGESFWKSRSRNLALRRRIKPDESPFAVISAFGGLGVYRAESIRGCRYSAVPTVALHDFYIGELERGANSRDVRRLTKLASKTHHEGAMLGCEWLGDGILYRNNSGYGFPVCAEHVNLHMGMRARDRGNFLIAPDLIYQSDH
jgi:hypothetical protein